MLQLPLELQAIILRYAGVYFPINLDQAKFAYDPSRLNSHLKDVIAVNQEDYLDVLCVTYELSFEQYTECRRQCINNNSLECLKYLYQSNYKYYDLFVAMDEWLLFEEECSIFDENRGDELYQLVEICLLKNHWEILLFLIEKHIDIYTAQKYQSNTITRYITKLAIKHQCYELYQDLYHRSIYGKFFANELFYTYKSEPFWQFLFSVATTEQKLGCLQTFDDGKHCELQMTRMCHILDSGIAVPRDIWIMIFWRCSGFVTRLEHYCKIPIDWNL